MPKSFWNSNGFARPQARGSSRPCGSCAWRTPGRCIRGAESSAPGAGDVGDVGRGLAREHRVVGHAELLRALDLAVPVGALHQAHADAPAQADKPVAHGERALLVGLHGEPEREFAAVSASKRSSVSSRRSDSSASMVRPTPRSPRVRASELDAGQQLGEDPGALRLLEARMQRRELDGDGVGRADGVEWRAWIGLEVAAPRLRRCAPPRPACRRRSGRAVRPAARATASSMVSASTNWPARMRIAWRTAVRTTGSPRRATSALQLRREALVLGARASARACR